MFRLENSAEKINRIHKKLEEEVGDVQSFLDKTLDSIGEPLIARLECDEEWIREGGLTGGVYPGDSVGIANLLREAVERLHYLQHEIDRLLAERG